ncbi:MAG: hypothetical protein L0Y72_19220 [Gemmataceae bacterium]|nr:hypothetical protein [Gemmataceae bacterium]
MHPGILPETLALRLIIIWELEHGARSADACARQGDFLRIVLRKLDQIDFRGPIGFQGYGIKGDARSILQPTIDAWRKLSAVAPNDAPSR